MEQTQNPTANIASNTTGRDDIPTSQFNEINQQAVNDMRKVQTLEQLEQIMTTALSQAATKYGRPFTYAEMRAEFG